jgi:hypothetical protein
VAARSSRLTFRRGGFQPSCDEKSNRLLRNSAAESPFLPTGGWIRPRCQRFGFVSLAGHIDQRAKASCSLYVWSPRLRASRKSHGRDVGDAKGAMLAFNSFATRSPGRASVASTDATWAPLFDASVIFTSAPNRRWLTRTDFIDWIPTVCSPISPLN